jgi:hypothetical protein
MVALIDLLRTSGGSSIYQAAQCALDGWRADVQVLTPEPAKWASHCNAGRKAPIGQPAMTDR